MPNIGLPSIEIGKKENLLSIGTWTTRLEGSWRDRENCWNLHPPLYPDPEGLWFLNILLVALALGIERLRGCGTKRQEPSAIATSSQVWRYFGIHQGLGTEWSRASVITSFISTTNSQDSLHSASRGLQRVLQAQGGGHHCWAILESSRGS